MMRSPSNRRAPVSSSWPISDYLHFHWPYQQMESTSTSIISMSMSRAIWGYLYRASISPETTCKTKICQGAPPDRRVKCHHNINFFDHWRSYFQSSNSTSETSYQIATTRQNTSPQLETLKLKLSLRSFVEFKKMINNKTTVEIRITNLVNLQYPIPSDNATKKSFTIHS